MQDTAALSDEFPKNIRYNILFLTKWYPNKFDPQLGIFVKKHAKAVSAYGNVKVLYICADDSLKSACETIIYTQKHFTEITVYYKKNSSLFKGFINLFRYINATRMGMREVQKSWRKIDLIHANVLVRTGLIALFIKKLKGIPYIITEHWTGYVSGKYEKQPFLKKWFTKLIIKNANVITTVSDNLRKKMLKLGLNGNYRVVPNIIESIELSSSQNEYDGRKKIKILTIADLADSHKNISGIIKAIAHIYQQNNSHIEYHIIGDGPDMSMLCGLAGSVQGIDKVIFFHGRQPNEYIYDFLKQIDFVIINSNFETFSVVAAEALINGKPVISTICGGPEEFITPDCGILIEPGDQKQLEDAIGKMIATYREYDALKLNRYITEKYSYQIVGHQFYSIYKEIIQH